MDAGESERIQPPIDRRWAADGFEHGIAGGVIALDDHQLQELAERQGDATVWMPPRQRAARPYIAPFDGDSLSQCQPPLGDLPQQFEGDRQLVDAGHRESLPAVEGEEPGTGFDV